MRRFALGLIPLFFAVSGWSLDLPHYAVILNDAPAATASARGDRIAMQAARPSLLRAQDVMKAELRTRGIEITGTAHTFLNAIFVAADPAEADQLRSLPGVSHVARLARYRLNLDRAEQLIGVPAAWNLLGGTTNAGAGVRIGIIDTGIEATHPAFQDSSITPPAGFPVCQVRFGVAPTQQWIDCSAADATKGFPICQLGNCAFTNSKVIVARSYVSMLAGASFNTSRPDDTSPRDRIGHGTAVAMAAAGRTNQGPADVITGVAPKAFLGSYKVFGSPGINEFTTGDIVIQALEDAFRDGMDIVVLSLGAPALAGPLDTGKACGVSAGQVCDPEAYVVQNAVNAGMLVVAAAGNSGANGLLKPTLNTMNSPGDAPGAIAVAATTNAHSWGNALTVEGLGTYRARYGSGPLQTTNITGTLGDIAGTGDPLACTSLPAESLNGVFALVQRGTCTFAIKIQNLEKAGAVGAIIINNPGDETLFTAGGLAGSTIPAASVGYGDGQIIRAYIAAHAKTTLAISPVFTPFDVTDFNQVASFSSRGPVLGTGALKPDVAAVGADLYLAGETYDPNGALYGANGYLVSQGTSFSAPQVAGVAALVKQAYPNLTASQIKSAVVNTATQDVVLNGSAVSVLAVGAGKVDARSAVTTNLIASPTSVSFGVLNAGSQMLTQEIQLSNLGSTALSLTVALNRRTPEDAAHVSIDLPNVTVPPGETRSINLLLSGSQPGPGIYEGFVAIQGGTSALQIPWLYTVGDGVPYNLISLAGDGDDGTVGKPSAGGFVIVEVVDRYGVPVPNLPVTFGVESGGGQLLNRTPATDNYGLANASIVLGPNPGTNVFTATAGALTASFQAVGRPQPTISPNGVLNAASFASQKLAPGSYISLFGSNLADAVRSYSTPYLPISLNEVSISFDNPNVSVPGHLVYVSPQQVNVQIPWELQGQPSVVMKVNLSGSYGATYTLPLAGYSPALFELTSGGQQIAASLDESYNVVTVANPVARGHVLQLFVNGLGPVSNQPASGDPAPVNPLARTIENPVVTIGNQNADVQFSGLAPGYAALYQVNVVVPNTAAGMQPVTISISGVSSTVSSVPVK
jgi:minor extracellular serine protease Vpr